MKYDERHYKEMENNYQNTTNELSNANNKIFELDKLICKKDIEIVDLQQKLSMAVNNNYSGKPYLNLRYSNLNNKEGEVSLNSQSILQN